MGRLLMYAGTFLTGTGFVLSGVFLDQGRLLLYAACSVAAVAGYVLTLYHTMNVCLKVNYHFGGAT